MWTAPFPWKATRMSMLRAKQSFAPDAHRIVGVGQTIDENHPIAKQFPNMFEPVQPDIRWETATASPGPVRHVVPAPPETKGEQIAREAEEAIEAEKKAAQSETSGTAQSTGEAPVVEYEEIDPKKFSLTELKTLARREGVSDVGTAKEPIADLINDKRAAKASGK